MLLGVKPDFKTSTKDVQKFLTFVRIGFSAAATGFDAEKVRFHYRLSPGKQLHANVRSGFEDFSLMRANQARIVAGGFRERGNGGAIGTVDSAEGGVRRAPLSALQGAEESH